jgi:thymidylate synthase
MSEGFPLLTTKKMAVKTLMTELKWFLKGDTNIKYLVDNKCNIWNGDAYKNYEKYAMSNSYGTDILSMKEFIEQIKTDNEFAAKWGDLGPIYGNQWRSWTEYYVEKFNGGNPIIVERTVDQIENLINDLKTNPDSRRLMVSAWNVGELGEMTLPPCHYGFQVYTRELSFQERFNHYMGKTTPYNGNAYGQISTLDIMDEANTPTRAISLMWNQRSVDTFLGLPFNIASYGMLLELLAKEVNMVPDELIGNLGDTHLYSDHIEQAKEQIDRESYSLPTIELSNVNVLDGEFDYELKDYIYHPPIKAPLSN